MESKNLFHLPGVLSISIIPQSTDRIEIVTALKEAGYNLCSNYDKCNLITDAIPPFVSQLMQYSLTSGAQSPRVGGPLTSEERVFDPEAAEALLDSALRTNAVSGLKTGDSVLLVLAGKDASESAAIIVTAGSLASFEKARVIVEGTFCTRSVKDVLVSYQKEKSKKVAELRQQRSASKFAKTISSIK